MNAAILILATLVNASPVEVSTLDGETIDGQLASINDAKVVVNVDGKDKSFPIDQVTAIVFDNSLDAPTEKLAVRLLDGSHLTCSQAVTAGGRLKTQSKAYGKLSIPLSQVLSVRFAEDPRLQPAWSEYHSRKQKQDLLVIRKKDGSGLDHSPGIVASITEKTVPFILGGDEIPLKRERIFGVIFSRTKNQPPTPKLRIKVGKTDQLNTRSVSLDGEAATIELMSGVECKVAATQLASIDLSSDKIVFLSELEPRQYDFVPFFGESEITLFKYRKDETEFRRPIRLAGKTYKRGLSIHSKTTLSYRINGDYRRFQTVMGIDYDRVRRRVGHVHVVISGDKKVLFEGDVDHSDPPVPLDLDVGDVRDLKILVDYGEQTVTTSSGEEKTVLSSMGDWLDLANARVIK